MTRLQAHAITARKRHLPDNLVGNTLQLFQLTQLTHLPNRPFLRLSFGFSHRLGQLLVRAPIRFSHLDECGDDFWAGADERAVKEKTQRWLKVMLNGDDSLPAPIRRLGVTDF